MTDKTYLLIYPGYIDCWASSNNLIYLPSSPSLLSSLSFRPSSSSCNLWYMATSSRIFIQAFPWKSSASPAHRPLLEGMASLLYSPQMAQHPHEYFHAISLEDKCNSTMSRRCYYVLKQSRHKRRMGLSNRLWLTATSQIL